MPFGIGPLQFHKNFPEDPHNSYLNAFMAGGWLSGFVYLTLVLTTLLLGLRHVFVRTPWQPTISRSTARTSEPWPKASSSTATTGGTTSCCSA